ncbi:MAG: hypothetical protein Kow0098_11360 [Ignavibacteriaceae bacterium]
MISNYLKSIEGISVYPIISLLIFFLFFIALVYRVVKTDKKYLNKMSNMPLENDFTEQTNSTGD